MGVLATINFCAYFRGSRLKVIIHWFAQLFAKSLFKLIAEDPVSSLTTEKGEVSSANNFELDARFSDKSLMYIKKSSGPRIEPWGAQASTCIRGEFSPFKGTLCFLLFKSVTIIKRSPDTSFFFS